MLKSVKKVENRIAAVSASIPEWLSNGLVTLLSTFLILMSPMAVHGLDGPGRWKNYSWLGIVIVLVMVLLLARYMTQENTPKKIRWSIVIPALLFVGSMFVSECLVPKVRPVYQGVSKCYLAYLLLGAVMGRYDRVMEKFWEDFMNGVIISFVLGALFCFLFRPQGSFYGYSGFYPNCNSFGIYLVLVCVAITIKLHKSIFCARQKIETPFCCTCFVLMCFFVVKSGSRAALLNVIFLMMLWPLMLLSQGTWQQKWKRICALTTLYGTIIIFSILSYSFMDDMLEVLPAKVNYPIVSENDTDDYRTEMETYGAEPTVYKKETQEEKYAITNMGFGMQKPRENLGGDGSALSRLWNTLQREGIEGVLGDRYWIYKYGITHLDWMGHENGTFTDDEGRSQTQMHNMILQYGYVYGYPAMFIVVVLSILLFGTLLTNKNHLNPVNISMCMSFAAYHLVFVFESGGTVIRDIMVVPHLLIIGMLWWKLEKKEVDQA